MKQFLASTVDKIVEASIVGSFTKIGVKVRSRLYDMEPVSGDLTGQRALVTGATSGIGKEVARQLVALGGDVAITSRSLDRAAQVADELASESQKGSATAFALDTSDFDSVGQLAQLLQKGGKLDMVLHNAGALSSDYQTNSEGIEVTLASHLIGPYLLTKKLTPSLTAGARVIWMSSGGMYTQGLNLDSLEMSEENYKGAVAYAKAKRAQVELVSHLGPQWAPDVQMHAMHPGWVNTPGIEASLPGFGRLMKPLLRSAKEGADTMIWLAAGRAAGQRVGQFWHDRKPRRTVYLPGTSTDNAERERLIEYLNSVTA